MANPFHRVRYFTGEQYREAWLRDAGVFVQLCSAAKGVAPCPGYEEGRFALEVGFDEQTPPSYGGYAGCATATSAGVEGLAPPQPQDTSGNGSNQQPLSETDDPDDRLWDTGETGEDELDEGEVEAQENDEDLDVELEAEQEGLSRKRGREAITRTDAWGYGVLVLVHEEDIHTLGVAYCVCHQGKDVPHDEQLLRFGGLFPATKKEPKTAFSLEGLACHQMDRLECKVAPQAISRRLRRKTRPLHPSTVPVSFIFPAFHSCL